MYYLSHVLFVSGALYNVFETKGERLHVTFIPKKYASLSEGVVCTLGIQFLRGILHGNDVKKCNLLCR